MEIKALSELEGHQFGWWAKGHYKPEEFVRAIDLQSDVPADREAKKECVYIAWWRCVPCLDEDKNFIGTLFKDSKPHVQGSFKVTVVEW